MSDRCEHSNRFDPDRWEANAVFRETFLHIYAEAELRAAFRLAGSALYEGAMVRDEAYTDRGEAPIAADLRAAARDLRQAQGYILERGEQHRTDSLDTPSTKLSLLALEIAEQIGALAGRIETAIGPAPGGEA